MNGKGTPSLFDRFEQAYSGIDGYSASRGRTFAVKLDEHGEEQRTTLAQFVALPVEAIARDDGAEVKREFLIDGISSTGQLLPPVLVPAGKLASMTWPLEAWGFAANINPGQSNRDKLRYAITAAGARSAKERTVFTHTGWRRRSDGGWMYLHGGGAVGCDGVSVELEGALSSYVLPDRGGDMLPSLGLLDVLPRRIAIPLLGHVFLAPLVEFLQHAGCPPLYTLFLAGSSGAKKTTAAALALAHFGSGFNVGRLPSNFHDTAATIGKKAFLVKDAPLLIDDLHPVADPRERAKMDGVAQNMARAWGDRAERGRMRSDLTLQTAQPPRGIGIITGESLPDVGESGVARFFLVDVHRGEIQISKLLTDAQRRAAQGELAASMRSFIEWLIPQAGALPDKLGADFERYRETARNRLTGAHDRQPPAVAWLLIGYGMLLDALVARGEIDATQRKALFREAADVLVELAKEQRRDMAQEAPAELFLSTLAELEAAGAVCIKDLRVLSAPAVQAAPVLGYRDDRYTYLLPMQVYGAINDALRRTGRCFPISRAQLWKHLAERGLIELDAKGNASRTKRIGSAANKFVWLLNPREEQMSMLDSEGG